MWPNLQETAKTSFFVQCHNSRINLQSKASHGNILILTPLEHVLFFKIFEKMQVILVYKSNFCRLNVLAIFTAKTWIVLTEI